MAKGKDNKPHIGIFGRRNNGKSSLINNLSNQDIAIVSNIAGTTTDPVKKSIEIPFVGPVIIIDTAGIDDIGELGEKRVAKSLDVLKVIDIAILVITNNSFEEQETKMVEYFKDYDIPFFIIHNKADLTPLTKEKEVYITNFTDTDIIDFSALNSTNNEKIIELIQKHIPQTVYKSNSLVSDLVKYGDIVLLITPIDIEAPEGRLILPQVQAIRDILDNDCVAIVIKEKELDAFLKNTNIKPALAITDSQIFLKADASIPKDIPLTSFSILLAHHKGDFNNYLKGTPQIAKLKDNDKVLILESCTHHVSCDDIGRIKIPRWLSNYTGKNLIYDVVSGLNSLPRPINDYAIVIQCGGCVLTRKQIINRLKPAVDAGVPVTNYGMAIAYIHGIYNRSITPFTKNRENNIDYL